MPDPLIYMMIVVYWGAALTLQLYGLNCYVMIYLFSRRRKDRCESEREILNAFASSQAAKDLPVVTTQLPIFNERNVVERLVHAVCAFDYPQGKHEIQLLDDSTDETHGIAAHLVAELRSIGHDIHHIHRTERSGYKAGALQAGLERARGEIVAVFDADFVPPPDFLLRTIPFLVMDPRCGFVQTRWGHRNRHFSSLTRVQAIGIDGHFVIEQSARSWNGLFFNFNGTGGIWRKDAIQEAGGWQSDTLTEDLDLSYRTQLAGWQPRFLVDVITPAELPTDINALKSQQHRWAKGSIQTARKLLPRIWRRSDVSVFKKMQSTVHLTHYTVHPLMLLMTLLLLPLLVLTQFSFRSGWMTVPIVLMLLALLAPSTMYFFSQRLTVPEWKRTIWLLPLLMSVGIGLAVNNTRAVLQGLWGQRGGEFVRTPKLGEGAEVRSGESRRRSLDRSAGNAPAGVRPGGPRANGVQTAGVEASGLPSAGAQAAGVQAAGVQAAGVQAAGVQEAGVQADRTDLAGASGIRHYRLPRQWIFLLEIFMGLWALAAFVEYLHIQTVFASPILLIHAVGFTYIGVLSLMHDLRARRSAA